MANALAYARFATLVGAVLTSLSAGTNYVFSAYAPQLGSRLHITHTQLNIIGLSGNLGVYITAPLFGHLVDKHGPRPLLIFSAFFLFTGYTGLRAYYDAGTSSGKIFPLASLIIISIFSFMTGAGGNAGLTAASNTTAKSFPERMRATTVGLVLSGFGLSAFFFSTLANMIFPSNTSAFLLCLSLGTALPVMIGIFLVRPVPHAERPEAGPGGWNLPIDNIVIDSSTHLLRDDTDSQEDVMQSETQSRRSSIEWSSTCNNPANRRIPSSRKSVVSARPFVHSDPCIHGKSLLFGWEFWLLFMILSLLSGTGLMFINNVGSISLALSAKGNPEFDRLKAEKVQNAQVSIVSLANCASRIAIGVGADFAKSRLSIHRSYLLSLVSTLFIISQIVGSRVENVENLWQASVVLGLGYGGIFGLLPTITIEWFGLSHFSENWGFVSLGPLLGGNVFSILFGRNLDAHAPHPSEGKFSGSGALRIKPPDNETERQCLEGRACYADAMGITTLACVVALGLSLIAAWRDRRRARSENVYESLQNRAVDEIDAEP